VKLSSLTWALKDSHRPATDSGVTREGKGGSLPPGAPLWGRQTEVGMLRTNYEMSADANNYNLQNVECHCEISSRSPRFAKRAILNCSSQWDGNPAFTVHAESYIAHAFRAAIKLT